MSAPETKERKRFVVQTAEFEGPLDTLLSMIRQRKLYINDISLAAVTDDYIAYINEHEESLDEMAAFVRTAATLILAKSKSLLPDQTTEEEETEIDELENRLRAYQVIKRRAERLQEQFGEQPLFANTQQQQDDESIFAPGKTLDQDKLADSIANCFVDIPDDSLPHTQIDDTVSLQEEITRLQDRFRKLKEMTFASITRTENKYHQVVSFVALLELIKLGELSATQIDSFGPITIKQT